jgi:hypothetical protein
MRRLFVLLLGLGLLGPVAGCHHLAGFCDCTNGCYCAAGSPQTGTPMLWMSAGPPAVEMGPVVHEEPGPNGVHPAAAVEAH